MCKLIYFNSNNQATNIEYYRFLDYAFEHTDYFMLVYINYYGKGYSHQAKQIREALAPYQVKTRTDPRWPGTLGKCAKDTKYKIIFYKTEPAAKIVLKKVNALSDWSYPLPEDLAFFKGCECWFYSVGHENIAAILRASNEDIKFLECYGLAERKNAREMTEYYLQYDEDRI